jgi:cytochrome c oxidase subunit 3
LTAVTTALGFCFLAGQALAWVQILGSGVILARNPHSWFLFLFTGLHGIHIVVGLSGLILLLARTYRPAGGPRYQMTTRAVASAVAIFWHYLDFVWVVLFALLFFWKR